MSRGTPRALTAYAVLFTVFLYMPSFVLPVFSLNDSTTASLPLAGFTWRWYGELARTEALHRAVRNSLQVGVAAALLGTVMGTLAARAVTRYRFPAQRSITGFIMLPLVLPEVVVAVALLVVLLQLGLEPSLLAVTLGHVLLCTPFAMAIMTSSFDGFDRSLEEASRDLGEGAAMTFWRVTLPVVAPAIVASLLVCFTISLDEFILAFFLTGTEATIPIYIWGQLRFAARLPGVLALGTLMLIASFLLLALAQGLQSWNGRRTGTKGGLW